MDSTREDIAIEDFLESCESKDLGHLGLVAGTSEELEIGRRIDDHIAQDFSQREVSVGQAARAMVLNGLGFAQQSLYLTPQFFESKPTERLIGEGIEPGHFHDDTLGRPKKRPEAVAGDRAYDSKENRKWCWERNIESVIPARNGMHTGPGRPPTCDEKKYERRNVVERLVGRLKERRRIATRHEKKASHRKRQLQGNAAVGLHRRVSEAIILRQSLVYSAHQWRIRQGLKETGQSYPDQKGNPT